MFHRHAVGFCRTSFLVCLASDRHSIFFTGLLPSLLITLSFAAFLNIYSLWHFRNEHRQTDQAFRDTDCEFSSIFRNVLDGILIADDGVVFGRKSSSDDYPAMLPERIDR